MTEFLTLHGLDLFTTLLGLLYLVLEYKAHIALWIVGIVMPALDVWLYWSHGLYGDAGMAVYYTLAALYGYLVWKFGKRQRNGVKRKLPIVHFPLKWLLPVAAVFLAVWVVTYLVLVNFTNSTIPVTDAFTNALSIVALWMLSHKYVEQWWAWVVVDAVSTYLYVTKGVPFKALLYGLYTVIAVLGYLKWRRMMTAQTL